MASARSAYCRACAPSSASRAAIWENRSVWGERLSITGWPQKAVLLPLRKASRESSPCAAWRNGYWTITLMDAVWVFPSILPVWIRNFSQLISRRIPHVRVRCFGSCALAEILLTFRPLRYGVLIRCNLVDGCSCIPTKDHSIAAAFKKLCLVKHNREWVRRVDATRELSPKSARLNAPYSDVMIRP